MRSFVEQFFISLMVNGTKGGSSGDLVDGALYALAGLGVLALAWWQWHGAARDEEGNPTPREPSSLVLTSVLLALGGAVLCVGLVLVF